METVFDPHLGKMVDRRTGMPVDGNTQPPARASTLDQMFNGTGIPERVNLMSEILNPMVNMRDAGAASQTLFDPDTTGWGRVGAFGNMASNMAAVLAPVMGAKAAGTKPVDAVVEALTNYSSAAKATGGEFLADELGGIKAPGYGRGITAYHGSPHSFDKFSMDKIGTGEGAQAYGHGLYFAGDENVARVYREGLSSNQKGAVVGGREYRGDRPEDIAAMAQATGLGEDAAYVVARYADAGADHVERVLSNLRGSKFSGDQDRIPAYEAAVKFMRETPVQPNKPGSMYEVRINANPDDFLDWDKPLSEQPAKVRDWFDSRGITPGFAGNQSGAELLLAEKGVLGAEGTTSAMREASIPGIKYLDHGSRFSSTDAATNTRNYVVFDENLIEIVRKYGIAGAAAMLGMSAADLEASMQPQSMRDVLQ